MQKVIICNEEQEKDGQRERKDVIVAKAPSNGGRKVLQKSEIRLQHFAQISQTKDQPTAMLFTNYSTCLIYPQLVFLLDGHLQYIEFSL